MSLPRTPYILIMQILRGSIIVAICHFSISILAYVPYRWSSDSIFICQYMSRTLQGEDFSGYIHLPPTALQALELDQKLPVNLFFWAFKSQSAPATSPLTLYLNGGPGSSSVASLLRENGPCSVKLDSRTVNSNPWAWNQESSIIYIDQPVNTGFSYDVPANGTVNFRGQPTLQSIQDDMSVNFSSRIQHAGTIGRGLADSDNDINSTEAAVRSIWLSLAIWIKDFPEFSTRDNGLEVWTTSYGGHYAPGLYQFTVAANAALAEHRSTLPQAPKIRINSIGLLNACVDPIIQLPAYPEMAYKNTYGKQLINETLYHSAKKAWGRPDGCKSHIEKCRLASGPTPCIGNNSTANSICHDANVYCGQQIAGVISPSGRNFFDIGHRSHFLTDPSLNVYLGYLRQAEVQEALRTQVNFTDQVLSIAHAFSLTGDNVRGDYVASLAHALDSGVKVSLIYGDRDYACNWLGGETLSLSIPSKGQASFQCAGYTPMSGIQKDESGETPRAYIRQHGGLSFVRVLDSGHTTNAVWPSLGFALFNRTRHGVDLPTGYEQMTQPASYSTTGPSSIEHIRNRLPTDADSKEGMCYVLALSFCSNSQLNAYLSGAGKVIVYWLMDYGNGSCCPNPIHPCPDTNSDIGETQVFLTHDELVKVSLVFGALMLLGAVVYGGILGLMLYKLVKFKI